MRHWTAVWVRTGGFLVAVLALTSLGVRCGAAEENRGDPGEKQPGLEKNAAEKAPASGKSKDKTAADKDGANLSEGSVDHAKSMARFLDRLMLAESGGRDHARNPRSTAVGPFQFIEATFIDVTRRHFHEETNKLERAKLLRLRTNRPFARRAAEAYTRDNAGLLAAAGKKATFANLRLAYLVGPSGAIQLLEAEPSTPVARVLGGAVVRANPFMARMTSGGLVRWAARSLDASDIAGVTVKGNLPDSGSRRPAKPRIKVRCNRDLASCRRWISLAERRLAAKERKKTR
ncbi:MAG: hypothetical protein ACK5JT_02955 [Hyphomicrobiaceae bacterium]